MSDADVPKAAAVAPIVTGTFEDLLRDIVWGLVDVGDPDFKKDLELYADVSDDGSRTMVFIAFGRKVRYESVMTEGQWQDWQARAKTDANFDIALAPTLDQLTGKPDA